MHDSVVSCSLQTVILCIFFVSWMTGNGSKHNAQTSIAACMYQSPFCQRQKAGFLKMWHSGSTFEGERWRFSLGRFCILSTSWWNDLQGKQNEFNLSKTRHPDGLLERWNMKLYLQPTKMQRLHLQGRRLLYTPSEASNCTVPQRQPRNWLTVWQTLRRICLAVGKTLEAETFLCAYPTESCFSDHGRWVTQLRCSDDRLMCLIVLTKREQETSERLMLHQGKRKALVYGQIKIIVSMLDTRKYVR